MYYLAAAFIAVWGLIAAYVFYMGLRQRSQEQELTTLIEMAAEKKRTRDGNE